jgi:hypothetical protein
MSEISHRLYKDVAGLSEEVLDVVVPTGKTWEVFHFTGSAAYLDDTVACLVWDPTGTPEIIDCTHGDKDTRSVFEVTGDGTKVLRISLQNDTNTARVMGAQFEARDIT